MTDEDAFLRAVLADPAAATPRLVYADWLDDQGDPVSDRKARFIRLEERLAETPERSLNHIRFVGSLQQLAAGLDPEWLAVVGHPALEACRLRFQFECPARWDRLTPTTDPRVRHCASCDRAVFHCDTIDEARRHAAAGECVAVSPVLVRRPDDLLPPYLGPLRDRPAALQRVAVMGRLPGRRYAPRKLVGPATPPDPRDEPIERPKQRGRKQHHRDRRQKHVRLDEFDE